MYISVSPKLLLYKFKIYLLIKLSIYLSAILFKLLYIGCIYILIILNSIITRIKNIINIK
jgi:hypothetical protein